MSTPNLFNRRKAAKQLRDDQAQYAFDRPHPDHLSNGDESRITNAAGDLSYLGNYNKGFEHDPITGELTADGIASYNEMLTALNSGNPADFEAITLALTPIERKLVNPQAGLAFDLEGPDAVALTVPPAPSIESAQFSGEMAELYWMMLCRDVSFELIQTGGSPLIGQAIDPILDGSLNWNDFTDLRQHLPTDAGIVTAQTIFRGTAPGCTVGPYVSQFLLIGNEYPDTTQYSGGPPTKNPDDGYIRYGTQVIDQRSLFLAPMVNYIGEWDEYIEIQNGKDPYTTAGTRQPLGGAPRFITTPRDLANYVHYDALYQSYLNACIILLGMSAKLDRGNPYLYSDNQEGFGTFGGPQILSLVTEVATRALKVVWQQKWFVHRRLRPEAGGGIIEAKGHRGASHFPINDQIMAAFAAAGPFEGRVTNSNNAIMPGGLTYLLNQVFPEGSPMHPSYGAGHATVAGACVTILKAFFDESMPFSTAYQAEPLVGATLITAPLPIGVTLNVGGELNKLANNIALGRNMAGVHYRSDDQVSLELGEALAIQILQEMKPTYNENGFYTLTKFDGTTIKI